MTPLTIAAGTLNPAKLRPVEQVFQQLWPGSRVQGVQAASGVSEQPIGVEETMRGAVQRARAARAAVAGAGYGVGLEGGVRFEPSAPEEGGGCWLFGIVAVTDGTRLEVGRSAELRLPPPVAARLYAGEELGPIMDELSGQQNIKQKAGTVGLLTGGLLSRADVWQMALTLSLAPFLHAELYQSQ
ncbi:inosine/xanthosine triphosphatase [Deinococcus sp. KNUC1210]|uniref:inosine/xanthosine triphosphatase n=1 Tax=Deinococcus sp. KNUC1210 TaxID=2917691 RepID=UPI001EF10E1E|nr:inosine/xanthosine triphosphatase [Deinococcus sp. KNUC1210]ULH14943.1 inosine/xanthosine triphosphatase [Deinococcus sp. KNUC1210]